MYDILSNLGISVFRIYSGMQQKQRIKHLNTFQKQPNSMLLATDVAARGLDLPNIETVINYHLPPTPTIFVHRSGRTARGGSRGLSLSLVSAQEKSLYHTIASAVGLKNGFPGFPLGLSVQPQIKQCVSLARKIGEVANQWKKGGREETWLKKTASEADLNEEEVEVSKEATLTNAERKKIRVGERRGCEE